MIRNAVTVSLVPEAKGGPFVFWGGLDESCRKAKALGYDGIELFAPGPEAIGADLRRCLDRYALELAGAGTGAGWVLHKLHLVSDDKTVRTRAREFVRSVIDAAAPFGAPAIIGSMQGRWGGTVDRDQALRLLAEALNDLGAHAAKRGVPLLLEPLNRYETNVVCTLEDGSKLLRGLFTKGVALLADTFHMNIEEYDLAGNLGRCWAWVKHVQFADSSRGPVGTGHTDFAKLAAALREIKYSGWVSAECLPWPDPDEAARRSIEAFRKLLS